VSKGAESIAGELRWLGIRWEEGPIRQSDRADRHREAAVALEGARRDDDGALRYGRTTVLRPDGTPTYPLASAVDDLDFRITHVIRGSDMAEGTPVQVELIRELGGSPPEFRHHGLLLGEDGKKLSKRHAVSALADLREAGIPPEAVWAYLEELGAPRHDVRFDLDRIRRLSTEAIRSLPDEELAARVGVPASLARALRGSRDLTEAREAATAILEPAPVSLPKEATPTLTRFHELRANANGLDADAAKAILRELKAVGGDLRSVRLALTGREHGPELWAVLAALDRDETLRRIDAAL
jgi:glutamyl-tRNA synthetase